MMNPSWFPKAKTIHDIEFIQPNQILSSEYLFEMLHHPTFIEWKEKTGVITPADGSAKTSTRLLKSDHWVFKTDLHQSTTDLEFLHQKLQQLTTLSQRVKLWHPQKIWFLMRVAEKWFPVSFCPLLTTIRQAKEWHEKVHYWDQMIVFGLRLSFDQGIGLDLNPSNFGYLPSAPHQLYYVDDELYAPHTFVDIGEAVVARIPEDATISSDQWQTWGTQLAAGLRSFCYKPNDWTDFIDGISEYPLAVSLYAQRDALLTGLTEKTTSYRVKKQTSEPTLTCIFSDIHANLPALETVLAETQRLGVDSYLFLGDVISYGPFPKECIQRLAELDNCIYLRGNHDNTVGSGIPEDGSNRMARELDQWTYHQLNQTERDWLLSLPIEYINSTWLAVHGSPQDPNRLYGYVYEMTYKENLTYLESHHYQVCFYGHTHIPFIHCRYLEKEDVKLTPRTLQLFISDQICLINPGSVGQPRDGDPRAAFALWDRQNNILEFCRLAYPIDKTIERIYHHQLPKDLVYRLEMGR